MSMRVSSNQMYSSGIGGIQKLQGELYTLQNQVDTGRRIVTPKDDPVGSAQALVVTQSASVNELYIKNQGTAEIKLAALDASLDGVNKELQNIYDKALAAGNGSYSDSNRAAVAAELEARLGSLISLANAQDGAGRYVFAGFQSTTQPFAQSGNAPAAGSTPYSLGNTRVTYNGDDGVQNLQVGAASNVATSVPGSEVFMRIRDANGDVTGRSIFDAVQNMVDFLKTPGVSASSPVYKTALGDIDSAMSSMSRVRATVGANRSSLDSMGDISADRKLQYKEQLSNLEDLDYAKALSDVSQKKLQLEASQATFAATSKLSLFDHI